ncbi:MAG: hypothetical protein R3D01_00225 [Hyphomicrobiales bacterium]
MVLQDAGYETLVAPGEGVLEKVEEADMKPAAVISDYNLSGGLDGIEAARKVSGKVGSRLPTIINFMPRRRRSQAPRGACAVSVLPQANGSKAHLASAEDGSRIGAQRSFVGRRGSVSA